MDRYVIKEPRVGVEYPQTNQMMAFPVNTDNSTPSECFYYGPGPYVTEYQNVRRVNTGVFNVPHNMGPPQMAQHTNTPCNNMMPGQSHMSGIDPRYLVGFADNAQYVLTGQQAQRNTSPIISSFGNEYQNRSFTGPDKNKVKVFTPQVMKLESPRVEAMPKPPVASNDTKNIGNKESLQCRVGKRLTTTRLMVSNVLDYDGACLPRKNRFTLDLKTPDYNRGSGNEFHCKAVSSHYKSRVPPKKPNELDLLRNDGENQLVTRADKLKALHKTGPRAFSGPVEKVLKWHKSLQDIGVLVLYEIVAKCVSVRSGESCVKNLVVRDENGPAMQVVYYEIDFLLPELNPPCTVRVIGRMLAGTCRLQAFNVRLASGDDVAMLPRRAAVAAHHVAKLNKEYGTNT